MTRRGVWSRQPGGPQGQSQMPPCLRHAGMHPDSQGLSLEAGWPWGVLRGNSSMQPHSPILLSAGGRTEPLQPKLLQAPAPGLLLHISPFPFLDTWRRSGGPREGPGFVGTSDHQGLTRKDGEPSS